MKLAVEISDASDLAPKDGTASCNPFVEVEFDEQRQRTATKAADLSPYWNQTLVFDVRDPASLPALPIDVSVFHDRRLHDQSAAVRPHTFIGRVRISATAVAPSAHEAVLQRYPLEKRGLFSRVSGDIALRIYLIQQQHDDPAAAAAAYSSNNLQPQAAAAQAATQHQQENHDHDREAAPRPRIFRSIPAPAASDDQQQQQQRRATLHAVAAPPPAPGQTVVAPRPAGPAAPGNYGLVETRPPLLAKLGPRGAAKMASTYGYGHGGMAEPMTYLYVTVVKARDLPNKDVTGALDPFVEVKVGNFKGVTRHLDKEPNPVWRQTFAFAREHLQSSELEVVVKDKGTVMDEFVGRVVFDTSDIPTRVPPDSPLAPQWYRLAGRSGDKLRHGEIMLAVWMGTQADEAFTEAWHSDAHRVSSAEGLASTRAKAYYSPQLVYLRAAAIAAQDLVPAEMGRPLAPAVAKLQLGWQIRRTRPQASADPVWNEEFMFVAAEPFEEPLVVTVEERVAPGRDEPVGRVIIPVAVPYVPRNDAAKWVESRWFSLSRALSADEAAAPAIQRRQERETPAARFSSKIHLRLSLETAYHVLDQPAHCSSDLQPAARRLRKPPVGVLELGILGARGLPGRNPYCVAKYGVKWVRTRTLLGAQSPAWNEQYTWEVFDPCTVLTAAVFDNQQAEAGGGEEQEKKPDQRMGKVRVRLSTLETDRVYTHLYPLVALAPAGLKKTGELHLAVRFTCTAWANMLAMYRKPLLPKAHYTNPIPVLQLDYLRFQAVQTVAARLARAEPPLRREVVEYILDADSHMFSLRRSKANFHRITSVLSGAVAAAAWMDGVRGWRNPATTVLVHVLFLILVCYPGLVLPTTLIYLSVIGLWNYRRRPRQPPHVDTALSRAEPGMVHPDELDEEMDTFPTTRSWEVVRMRYDRLRSVAGRVQTVAGDLATQGERAQALLSWRDPRATAIAILFCILAAVVLFVTPFQVVALVLGLYLLRHPRFRSKLPSAPFNFYKRLPAKSDMLL